MAVGIMNVEDTTAVGIQLSKKGTKLANGKAALYKEIKVFKPLIDGRG